MIVDLVSPWLVPGARVLDIGSGHGENAAALRSLGYRIVAVELDAGLVEQFRPRAQAMGVELTRADAERLPFGDDTFDAALLIEVFEHVPQPDRMLAEVRRVLRPGGHLLLAVPTGYTEAMYWRLHPEYASNAGHLRRWRRREVEHIIGSAGLQVVNVETRNLVPALSWLAHAALRSRSDQTGTIHEHHWVDSVLRVLVGIWRRLPVLAMLYRYLDRRVGKSWYFDCAKAT